MYLPQPHAGYGQRGPPQRSRGPFPPSLRNNKKIFESIILMIIMTTIIPNEKINHKKNRGGMGCMFQMDVGLLI